MLGVVIMGFVIVSFRVAILVAATLIDRIPIFSCYEFSLLQLSSTVELKRDNHQMSPANHSLPLILSPDSGA